MTDEELITALRWRTESDLSLEAADRIEALVKEKERLGREVNMARYGQPNFAWSIHKEAMADLQDRAERLEALTGAVTFALSEYDAPNDIHEAMSKLRTALAKDAALKGADYE